MLIIGFHSVIHCVKTVHKDNIPETPLSKSPDTSANSSSTQLSLKTVRQPQAAHYTNFPKGNGPNDQHERHSFTVAGNSIFLPPQEALNSVWKPSPGLQHHQPEQD